MEEKPDICRQNLARLIDQNVSSGSWFITVLSRESSVDYGTCRSEVTVYTTSRQSNIRNNSGLRTFKTVKDGTIQVGSMKCEGVVSATGTTAGVGFI